MAQRWNWDRAVASTKTIAYHGGSKDNQCERLMVLFCLMIWEKLFLLGFLLGLRPGTEYGMGVTSIKEERESLPATTNAVTGKI